ncbi:MAG: hypothetical protein N2169_07670 [bacterium]|nr:hypothetical protein [bacterium]
MDTLIESMKYKNYRIEIHVDLEAELPHYCMEFLGTIAIFHRDYRLSSSDMPFDTPEQFIEWAEKEKPLYLDIYMYEHSGIRLSTSPFYDPWDSGKIGWIYASKERVLQYFGRKKLSRKLIDKAYHKLESEIKMLDDYVTGDVFGYIVYDNKGEMVDSCWGFYGREAIRKEIKILKEWLKKYRPTKISKSD